MSSSRKRMIPPNAALVSAAIRRYPRRPTSGTSEIPAKYLDVVMACWSLCESGLIATGGSFSPLELEKALIDTSTEKQSPLVVAIHIGLARLVSKSSIALADTTTWRTSVVRAACSAAGPRVRSRVRHMINEAYSIFSENDDPRFEYKAVVGSIALHPLFTEEARSELISTAEREDVMDAIKPILSRYGRSMNDAIDILFSMIQTRSTAKEQVEAEEAEEARQEQAAAEEDLAEQQKTTSSSSRGRSSLVARDSMVLEDQPEVIGTTTVEEDETLAKALVKLDMMEYARLDLDSKCFILQWLCERVSDSKHVHDTIENAVLTMESEVAELEAMEKYHETACEEEKYLEAEAVLYKLREWARRDYLYSLYSKEYAKKYSKRPSRAPVAVDDEEDGGRSKRTPPEELVGKELTRTIYNVPGVVTVKSFSKDKDGKLIFRCEYENEKPLYEDLTYDEVRRASSSLFKCSDEEFLIDHCSDRSLRCINDDQYDLISMLFARRWGPRFSKDRQTAAHRIDNNLGKKITEVPKNKLQPGMRIWTKFGTGYLLAVRDSKMCDVKLDWGGLGGFRIDQISTSKSEPIVTGTTFTDDSERRVANIEKKKDSLRKMQLAYRLEPIARDAFDDALIYAKGDGECIVLAPATEEHPLGVLERCSKADLQAYFRGTYQPGPNHPNWEGESRDLDRKLKQNQSVATKLDEDPTAKSGNFQPPIWLAPEVFHQEKLAGNEHIFQPLYHVRFFLERLESELRPWMLSRETPARDIKSHQDAVFELLDMEQRLLVGLGAAVILKTIKQTEENATKPDLPAEPAEISINLPEESSWSRKRKPAGGGNRLTLSEVVASLTDIVLDDAWAKDDAKLQLCRAAAQEESPLVGWHAGMVLDKKRKALGNVYDRAQTLRTQLVDLLESKTEELWVKYSMDPVVAACCDGALMFLLRWLPRRRIWRSRVALLQSFSGIVTEAIKLESSTYELRRAGATASIPRDEMIRGNSLVCYSGRMHHNYLNERKPNLPIYLALLPDTELYMEEDDDYRKVKVVRVDLHVEFSYIAIAVEEEEEDDDSTGAAPQAAATEDQFVMVELQRRSRTNEDCVVNGCPRKAVVGNYGHCEVHRKLRRRGRPPTRAARLKREAEAAAAALADSTDADVDFKQRDDGYRDDDVCFICFEGGELICCDFPKCPKVYHMECLGRSFLPPPHAPNAGQEPPWHCPLHRLPEGSRERQVQNALLGVLNGVAMLENAEMLAGSTVELHNRIRQEESNGVSLREALEEDRPLATDLVSLRRRCICEAGYKSFDDFNDDVDAMRERFNTVAEETGNSRLRETTTRIWKFMKVKAGRARAAIDGPRKETRHNPLLPHHYRSQGQAENAESREVIPEMLMQVVADVGEKNFYEGEELDPSKFFEKVEPGSVHPVPPGRVLTNFTTAVEMAKANTWPLPWERCERIMKVIGPVRGKRKVDEFSMVEQFEPGPSEQVVMLYSDPNCRYLMTEHKLRKIQVTEKALNLSKSLQTTLTELGSLVTDFEQYRLMGDRVWYLMTKRAYAAAERGPALTPEEEGEITEMSQKFLSLCESLGLPLEQSVRRQQPEGKNVSSGMLTTFNKRARLMNLKPASVLSAFGSDAVPSRLLAEYLEAEAAGHSAYKSVFEKMVPDADPEVIRVVDDVVTTIETIEESEMGLRKDVFVTLVLDGKRIMKPSRQRLIAVVPRAVSERSPFYAAYRVGSQAYVRLNDEDESGWPAEVLDCRIEVDDEGNEEFFFDVKFEHDDYVENNVTPDRLISRPNPDRYFFKGTELVTVATRNKVRTGRMTKLDRELDEITVHFKDTNEELTFKSVHVRPQAWMRKSALLEVSAQASLENKRQTPLQSLEQPLNREAMARPAVYWMEVRFVTDDYALGDGFMTALVNIKADEEVHEWEPGDQVEVMMDHMRRRDNWRRGTVMRILPEPDSLAVRLEESNYRLIVTDQRFLRLPQPEPESLPLESEVEFVDPVEEESVQIVAPPAVLESEAKRARLMEQFQGPFHPMQAQQQQQQQQHPPRVPQQTMEPVRRPQQMFPVNQPSAVPSPARAPVPAIPPTGAGILPPGTHVLMRYARQVVPAIIVTHRFAGPGSIKYDVYLEFSNNYMVNIDASDLQPYVPQGAQRPMGGMAGPGGGVPPGQSPAQQHSMHPHHLSMNPQQQQQPQQQGTPQQQQPTPQQQQQASQQQMFQRQQQLQQQGQQQQQQHQQQMFQRQQQQLQQQQQHHHQMMSPTRPSHAQQMMQPPQQHHYPPQQQQQQQQQQTPSGVAPGSAPRMPQFYGGTAAPGGYPQPSQFGASQQPQQHFMGQQPGSRPSPFGQPHSQFGQSQPGFARPPQQQQQFAPSGLPPLSFAPIVNEEPGNRPPENQDA